MGDRIEADYYGVEEQDRAVGEHQLDHFVNRRDTGIVDRDSIEVHMGYLNVTRSSLVVHDDHA